MGNPEITEQNKTKPFAGLLNLLLFLLLAAAVCSMAFFIYLQNSGVPIKDGSIWNVLSQMVRKDHTVQANVRADIPFDPKEHPIFAVQKGLLLKISRDGVKWINARGEEEAALVVNTAEPLVKSSGNTAVAADIRGRDIYFIDGRTLKWSEKLDNRIINTDINEKGYVAVVTELQGYKAAVHIYDAQGNWISTTGRSENLILSARVLPGGDTVVINSLKGSEDSVESVLEFTDLKGNRIGIVEQEDVLFPVLWSISNDKVAAIGDNMILCLSTGGRQLWKKEHKNIYSSTVVKGGRIAAAVAGGNATVLSNVSDIVMYDSSGKELWKYEVKGNVSSMSSAGDTIVAANGRNVLFLSTGGKLLTEYDAGSDIIGVHMLTKDEAAIVTQGKIQIVILK